MAKHCTVCNQDYADELSACPHCASAKTTQPAGREDRTTQLAPRGEERTTQLGENIGAEGHAAPTPSDSAIDFGAPPSNPATGDAGGAEPSSGGSAVAWSSLVGEPRADEGREVRIDSPSDADILAHNRNAPEPSAGVKEELVGELSAEKPVVEAVGAHADTEMVDLAEAPPHPTVPPSSSAVDLGGSLAEIIEDESAAVLPSSSAVDLGASPPEIIEDESVAVVKKAPEGESEVFLAELASDASRVDLVSDSEVDLAGAEVVEAAKVLDAPVDKETPAAEVTEEAALDAMTHGPDSSAVDLGGMPTPSEELLSVEEVAAVAPVSDASGIDLQGLPIPKSSSGSPRPSSASSVDLGSQMEIAAPSPSGEGVEVQAGSGSGIDVDELAQVSEGSGIDVEEPAATAATESPSSIALESLLSDSPSGKAIAEETGAAHKQPAVSQEAGVEEPAVSEKEVNDLLAGLEETPAAEPGVTPEEAAEIAEGEEAIAAAEAEEAAEASAEEEGAEAKAETEAQEKPAKPVKPRSRIPALVGGTFLGMVIGAGGLVGARFVGVDVPAMVGAGETEKKAPQLGVGTQAKAKEPTKFEDFEAMVRNGDWAAAEKEGIENFQAAKANELAARGEYKLGKYLNKVGSIKNIQDPELERALQDLQKAAEMKDANAIYNLALVKELAGQLPEARAEYAKGAQTFQNDPEKKQWFESAIERVDWKASLKGGAAMLPLPQGVEDRAVLLALLLIGLQQPPVEPPQTPPQPKQQPGAQPKQAPPGQPGQQPPGQPEKPPSAPASTPEAGFEFWRAARLAREGKLKDAIGALDQARKLHDQRRFTRLRKSQNPLSDPAEDIFLRCCDELKAYWQMQNVLRDGKYLTDKNTPPEALQAVVQKADASDAASKDLKEKLVAAKIIGKDDDLSKGLDRLIGEKKKADDAAADLTTKLKAATDENTKLADDLKTAKKTIDQRDAALTAAKEENKKLQSAHGDANATLKKIAAELASADFLDPKGKGDVGEAVKKAVDVAKMKDPQGRVRQQRDEIAQLTGSLQQRWRPEEMLPLWLLLLDENRDRPELAIQATKDVERVKRDPAATPAEKSEAEIVLGLALRNSQQFAEAKPVLEAARNSVDKAEWLARANAALQEVSNPAAYFTQQAQALYDQGRMAAALAVLDRAMKVLPAKEQGKLLAQRSLIELDAAQSKAKGALSANDPLVVAARKDADEAAKAGLAEGHYAAGRIAEALGQVDTAISSYRAAVKAYGDKIDAEGGRYRMALARVLLLPREARPGPRVGWRDPAPYPAKQYDDVKKLVLLLTLGLQPPLLPGEEPGLEEAEKLADEVLKAAAARPGSVPFDVLAQALAVKGRWIEAWQVYVEGIRPMLPRAYGNGLVYLLQNDPRLRRPDTLRTPNPLEAEKHFAAGLSFYFDCDFANAEKEFFLTVQNNSQDARYFYFLGLSRLAQNRRRDAAADFDEGAKLERLNRPAPAAVSESLERIQGPMRQTLNEVRFRPEPLPERR
jgi:tetratricopeptide (TPR) repeat protein